MRSLPWCSFRYCRHNESLGPASNYNFRTCPGPCQVKAFILLCFLYKINFKAAEGARCPRRWDRFLIVRTCCRQCLSEKEGVWLRMFLACIDKIVPRAFLRQNPLQISHVVLHHLSAQKKWNQMPLTDNVSGQGSICCNSLGVEALCYKLLLTGRLLAISFDFQVCIRPSMQQGLRGPL